MISKQGIWFLTLFSLILVLSVYYVTMPNELLLTNNNNYTDDSKKVTENKDPNVKIVESDVLTSMRVAAMDERINSMKELQSVLTSMKATVEEKNNAYEQLKYLNMIQGQEEKLETKIKALIKKDVFIKVDNNQIKVVVASKEHNNQLANDIMRSIQEEYNSKMYISVSFKV